MLENTKLKSNMEVPTELKMYEYLEKKEIKCVLNNCRMT